MDKEFLPQYAAQAVADLEEMTSAVEKALKRDPVNAKAYLAQEDNAAIFEEARFMSGIIRTAVHVVLPNNGEVYRANFPLPTPTADEIESLKGLPAPTTCFEFYCDSVMPATKMLAVVIDRKQLDEGQTGIVVMVMREDQGRFPPTRNAVFFPEPLELMPQADKQYTAVMCRAFRVSKSRAPFKNDPDEAKAVELVSRGLHAAIQCCHSLRAGASLEERVETSPTRRWKMEKKGVGGFTYHVLKLPGHVADRQAGIGGFHASPRFHVRRAHIRKLPSGVLTFVRQCFVGDRDRGTVHKHYDVKAAGVTG